MPNELNVSAELHARQCNCTTVNHMLPFPFSAASTSGPNAKRCFIDGRSTRHTIFSAVISASQLLSKKKCHQNKNLSKFLTPNFQLSKIAQRWALTGQSCHFSINLSLFSVSGTSSHHLMGNCYWHGQKCPLNCNRSQKIYTPLC